MTETRVGASSPRRTRPHRPLPARVPGSDPGEPTAPPIHPLTGVVGELRPPPAVSGERRVVVDGSRRPSGQGIDVSVPAVVVPADLHYSSLNVIRSLGRLGVSVFAVNTHPGSPRRPSRYCKRSFVLDLLRLPPIVAVESLLAIGRSLGGRAVLIGVNDAVAAFAARHAAALRQAFTFPESSIELVESVIDKRQLHALAHKCGVPTATTYYPETRAELAGIIASIEFPVVLKGIDTQLQEQRSGDRMVVVPSAGELIEHFARMQGSGSPNLMVQEYISLGEDWVVASYSNSAGKCLAACTGRKLRQHPVTGGVTTLGECRHNIALARLTGDFLDQINYRGLADMDFRRDDRDGRFKLVDFNPRPGANSRLYVARSGLDMVRLQYLDLTGQEAGFGLLAVPEGRRWVVEDLDLSACVRAWSQKQLSLTDWWQSLRGVEEGAWFAWDDPVPVVRRALAVAGKRVGWVGRQIARRGSRGGSAVTGRL